MKKIRIKTGDVVKIIAGKDKGKSGKVIQTFPRLNRVVVDGVNVSKRHLRSRRQSEKGQIVEFAMPVHLSNVKLTGDDVEKKSVKPVKSVKSKDEKAKSDDKKKV